MEAFASHKTLVIACGALAKEILAIKASANIPDQAFELQCLPAGYHNFPDKIVPGLEKIIKASGDQYDRILIGYGDCGTGGGLDRMMKKEEELGSFFLTDYLAQHFETLIVKGFGIDRYPNLKETYFEHYKRLIYISQAPTEALIEKAKKAAVFLGLEFSHRPVGYGELESQIKDLGGGVHV